MKLTSAPFLARR